MLKGSPRQIGLKHGKEATQAIEHNLDVYFQRFKQETELSREDALSRASKYLDVIQNQNPAYAAAMKGVAEGSGTDLVEIAALNVRYELMYSQFSKIGLKPVPRTYGCTAFAIMPESSQTGHLLMGQNWDWIPQVEGLFLKIRSLEGPDVLCFTEAGVVGGKIGLNSEGLGLMINGLVSDRDDWSRLGKPFHVRCWEILKSRTLRQASTVVSEGKRSCSANFLLGQHLKTGEGAVVDMESAPEATCELAPVNGAIGHTNHFSDPQKLGVQQVLDEERKSTLQRYGRIQQLLDEKVRKGGKINFSVAQSMLRDHKGRPESICRHPNRGLPKDERYKTVVSIVMDLHDRRIWATIGSPCVNDYGSLRL